MKPFSAIAIPHKDIIEGRFTMDTFAADLWEVFKNRGPAEYKDPEIFFSKSYLTQGLKNLLEIAKKRLSGKGGDALIQLQTPFGGGKTHSLIALYHKARSWKANVVVIDGTVLDPREKMLWEEIEEQLTGKVQELKGKISPGREKIRKLFEKRQPLLILIDEILEYTTKASGISLVPQILAFVDELARTVKTLDKSLLILTLPSSDLEKYDESAEQLSSQIQQIVGRIERIYEPVQEGEVASIIRKRLFAEINEKEAKKVVDEFIQYAQREKILPPEIPVSLYRRKFLQSYPFQPEVIETLYKRWGSFPTFQRTRGVLRLLSLVVYSLRKSSLPYIRLADFDLSNQEIKRELIRHIGNEYDSIIAQDITSANAGAKKVDKILGDAYASFSFGTKVATTIFLYSFSGGVEKGATIEEIKLSSCNIFCPSTIITETLTKLNDNLLYLQSDGKFFFSTVPNLNRVLLIRKTGISEEEIREQERTLLKDYFKQTYFDVFLWPDKSKDISDTKRLKLIVLSKNDRKFCEEILDSCGEKPRVYKNTLIFLCPQDADRKNFEAYLKEKLAWQTIREDETLNLNLNEKKTIAEKIKQLNADTRDRLRSFYRIVFLPTKEGLKEIDLGIALLGEGDIEAEIYQRLQEEGEIVEQLSPLVLREKYLRNKDYVKTVDILNSLFQTPGEIRINNEAVLRNAIKRGIKEKIFGLGDLEINTPKCRYIGVEADPQLIEGEIIINPQLCKIEEVPEEQFNSIIENITRAETLEDLNNIFNTIRLEQFPETQREKIRSAFSEREQELKEIEERGKYKEIFLKLKLPLGSLSEIGKIIRYLRDKFNTITLRMEIHAKEGEGILPREYEDKIKETFHQAKIEIEDERFK